jgi:hypothetical protein
MPPSKVRPVAKGKKKDAVQSFEENWALAELKPHPKNYRSHPQEQVDHIAASIGRYGIYRRVVVARDGTILAGHGIAEAARKLGLDQVPVFRLDIDPDSPAALKVMTADNELGRFAESDDRALTELLRQVKNEDELGLLGTGFDDQMLAGLLMVTRPTSEVATFDAAAEWVGMPEYDQGERQVKLVVSFASEADRDEFVRKAELRIAKKVHGTWGARWPSVENEDVGGLRFET